MPPPPRRAERSRDPRDSRGQQVLPERPALSDVSLDIRPGGSSPSWARRAGNSDPPLVTKRRLLADAGSLTLDGNGLQALGPRDSTGPLRVIYQVPEIVPASGSREHLVACCRSGPLSSTRRGSTTRPCRLARYASSHALPHAALGDELSLPSASWSRSAGPQTRPRPASTAQPVATDEEVDRSSPRPAGCATRRRDHLRLPRIAEFLRLDDRVAICAAPPRRRPRGRELTTRVRPPDGRARGCRRLHATSVGTGRPVLEVRDVQSAWHRGVS